jgi:uncharacterized membrane protein YfcA
MRAESSDIDLKQRSQLLAFYLCAVAFSVALALAGHVHSPWREALRVVMIAVAGFAVWSFFGFLRIADERQRRINYQALGFALTLTLAISFFGGFIKGFGAPHVSWLGVLGLLFIPWSLGLIVFSWRYR